MTSLDASEPAADLNPQHIAIVMDGNGRWAQRRGLPRGAGHRAGMQAVERTLDAIRDVGVPYLTLFAFSAENWRRPPIEISTIMDLMREYLSSDRMRRFREEGGCFRVIGDRGRLSPDIRWLIERHEKATQHNSEWFLTVALSYGARQELTRAVQLIANKVATGALSADAIDEAVMDRHLFTCGLPDPDLLIRTSGEQRLSNFMLWQAAYTEFIFTETLWPDFDRHALDDALAIYRSRNRRFGALASGPP